MRTYTVRDGLQAVHRRWPGSVRFSGTSRMPPGTLMPGSPHATGW